MYPVLRLLACAGSGEAFFSAIPPFVAPKLLLRAEGGSARLIAGLGDSIAAAGFDLVVVP